MKVRGLQRWTRAGLFFACRLVVCWFAGRGESGKQWPRGAGTSGRGGSKAGGGPTQRGRSSQKRLWTSWRSTMLDFLLDFLLDYMVDYMEDTILDTILDTGK